MRKGVFHFKGQDYVLQGAADVDILRQIPLIDKGLVGACNNDQEPDNQSEIGAWKSADGTTIYSRGAPERAAVVSGFVNVGKNLIDRSLFRNSYQPSIGDMIINPTDECQIGQFLGFTGKGKGRKHAIQLGTGQVKTLDPSTSYEIMIGAGAFLVK
jgi:hypothetical protein